LSEQQHGRVLDHFDVLFVLFAFYFREQDVSQIVDASHRGEVLMRY
jgi:hypothetical protein